MVPQEYLNIEATESSWEGLNLVILTSASNSFVSPIRLCVQRRRYHAKQEWSEKTFLLHNSETSRSNTRTLGVSFLTHRVKEVGQRSTRADKVCFPQKNFVCFCKSLDTPSFSKVDRQTILIILKVTSDVLQVLFSKFLFFILWTQTGVLWTVTSQGELLINS